jgi:hypothetical protein
MLSHLRSLPEPAISPRTVEKGIGAGPGSLMRHASPVVGLPVIRPGSGRTAR